jgi:hypothetical protein
VNLAELLTSAASEFDASSRTLTVDSDSQVLSWMAPAPSMSTDSRSGMMETVAMSLADVETRYRDPLWALVTLDLEPGELVVEGRRAEWVGPDP